MNITVIGYGHFAKIVAMGLCEHGHTVCQDDESPYLLREGHDRPEPGYVVYPMRGLGIWPHVVWIAYDAPLDAQGAPVVEEILARIQRLHARYPSSVPFLVSCQWPVGTFRTVEALCPGRPLAYVLENVRVGHAVEDFRHPAAIIVGTRTLKFSDLSWLAVFTNSLQIITPESAEMAKHTLNAFLALQIAFINEIDTLCALVGADAREVSRALVSDTRVSPGAPLLPGPPFGGGSLKRDVRVLEALCQAHGISYYTPILAAILPSNER